MSLPMRKLSSGHNCVEKSRREDWTLKYNKGKFFQQTVGLINVCFSHWLWKITVYERKSFLDEPTCVPLSNY